MLQFTLALLFLLATIISLAAQDVTQIPSAPEPQTSEFDQQTGEKTGKGPEHLAVEATGLTKKMGQLAMVKARDWESGWLTGVFVKQGETMTPLTGPQRRELYLQQTLITPGAYMKRMFAAGIDQARGVPHPWDDGWDGYLDRFASREGQFITANSLAALGNAALKYEPRYDRCQCKGFWPRSRHAILRNFITFNETEVDRRPQLALYGGAFAGGALASVWKPHPRNALADGGWAMLGQAGWGSLLNFFIEFAGEINRKIGVKKQQVPPY
ncbi:MAG TPA: hypothetical protein VGS27_16105 [Candidatus Sulfotelmatobacter sp.]|nr:hypothetical protein [Candidatus Sulfotelmatobacter sp.]